MDPAKVCHQTHVVHANCDKCGERPEVLHKPAEPLGSRYCPECCPVCGRRGTRPRGQAQQNLSLLEEALLKAMGSWGLVPKSATDRQLLDNLVEAGYAKREPEISDDPAILARYRLTILGQKWVNARKPPSGA